MSIGKGDVASYTMPCNAWLHIVTYNILSTNVIFLDRLIFRVENVQMFRFCLLDIKNLFVYFWWAEGFLAVTQF